MQQLGGSLGAAVLATVLQQQLNVHAGAAGQALAFDHAFGWALALTALAAVPALLLPRRRGVRHLTATRRSAKASL